MVVSLLEGKVGLNNLLREEKEAVLSPDERAVLNKANGLLTVESVTASNASQWTDGYLFFDEELLPDIAKELERSYNVKIHIANDSLKTFRFMATSFVANKISRKYWKHWLLRKKCNIRLKNVI